MWQLVAAGRDNSPANVAVLRYSLLGPMDDWPTVMASVVLFGLPPSLLFFLALGLIQVLYLDRLALVAGKPDEGLEEPSVPETGPGEGAWETVRLEPESERETVRLEPEGAKVTTRLEPEGAKVTRRLEPETERKTVRLEPEGARVTTRLEPEGAKVTKRLQVEEEGKTVRLEPEEDDNEA
jgi:hypothetical protein